MCLQIRSKERNPMMLVGMVFLIIASLSRWFFQHHPALGENLADGMMGLFYGLAIGCLLLSLRHRPQASS
ncbi:MAG TPA: hypothetical protein VGK04_02205 [Thermoanaerobaculia bacterium]|jgi:hypothetical protein